MTLDAASSHPVSAKVGVQRVPTLREAVIFAKSQNLKLFLDVKGLTGLWLILVDCVL